MHRLNVWNHWSGTYFDVGEFVLQRQLYVYESLDDQLENPLSEFNLETYKP